MTYIGIPESGYFWNGGGCPVTNDAAVVTRFRYGPQKIARAAERRWSHDQYLAYDAIDIMAYALVPISRAPAAQAPLQPVEPSQRQPFALAGDTP